MKITAIVVPGSARWWLLSLTPLLFYDQIHVSNADIESIFAEGNNSSFHEYAANMMNLLLSREYENIIVRDKSLPAGGKTKTIENKARKIATLILTEAAQYSAQKSSLVKTQEVKYCMYTAYAQWIRYNRQKLKLLSKGESLANLLRTEQIPQSIEHLKKIRDTNHRNILELLDKDYQLGKVFEEVIRNALLISQLSALSNIRVYDRLIEEYLPAIELVERVRIINEIPAKIGNPCDITILWPLFNFHIRTIQSTSTQRIGVASALVRAIQERDKFDALRKRLAELDVLIAEKRLYETELKEIAAIITDISKIVHRIDEIGTWVTWSASTYLVAEMGSSFSSDVLWLLKGIFLNPFVTTKIKETIENIYIARENISPELSGRISIIRDAAIGRANTVVSPQFNQIQPEIFKFWV